MYHYITEEDFLDLRHAIKVYENSLITCRIEYADIYSQQENISYLKCLTLLTMYLTCCAHILEVCIVDRDRQFEKDRCNAWKQIL